MKGWGTAAMPFLPASSARVQPRARTHPPMDARAMSRWRWFARQERKHGKACTRLRQEGLLKGECPMGVDHEKAVAMWNKMADEAGEPA